MQVLTLKVSDVALDKIFSFLQTLPKEQIDILDSKPMDDWSFLEDEIQKGIDSGISPKSHNEIVQAIKQQYV